MFAMSGRAAMQLIALRGASCSLAYVVSVWSIEINIEILGSDHLQAITSPVFAPVVLLLQLAPIAQDIEGLRGCSNYGSIPMLT